MFGQFGTGIDNLRKEPIAMLEVERVVAEWLGRHIKKIKKEGVV